MKVYWYERRPWNEKDDENEWEIIVKENEEINALVEDKIKDDGRLVKRKEKIIQRKNVFVQTNAVRDACRALDHINKRYKCKYLASNYTRVNEVS